MRFGLFCFILCLGWQYAASSPVTATEYEYVPEADTWLRLHIVPANWSDAAIICQLEGGILASPTNKAITEFMKTTLKKHTVDYSTVFIGVTDLFSKGEFRSLDGLGLKDSPDWAKKQPNNLSNGQHCLALAARAKKGAGALGDVSCGTWLPYFCSKRGHNCTATNAEHPTSITSTNDAISPTPLVAQPCIIGYKWEPRTGSCYKFHGAAKSWRNALSTCHAEGGHLAIINSRTESSVLEMMYDDYADTITGADEARHAFIGFRKFDDGQWMTMYGESLSETGFQGWDQGEPSNGNGKIEESCGSIHRNGLMNDASCMKSSPFICEMAPNHVLI